MFPTSICKPIAKRVVLWLVLSAGIMSTLQAQNDAWSEHFAPTGLMYPESHSDRVEVRAMSLQRVGSDIFVGGWFTYPSKGIACWHSQTQKWDDMKGGAWSGLPFSGLYGKQWYNRSGAVVYRVLAHGDSVYVLGSYNSIGGSSCSDAAIWDARRLQWQCMPFQTPFVVDYSHATVEAQGRLVCIVWNVDSGRIVSQNIARFDGKQWATLLQTSVIDPAYIGNGPLCCFRGDIIAQARTASDSSYYVYKLDSAAWTRIPLRTTIEKRNRVISCMKVLDDKLYVGGYAYGPPSSTRMYFLDSWDGKSWTPHLDTLVGVGYIPIRDIDKHDSLLCICGDFEGVNSTLSQSIALCNLSTGTWTSLAGGLQQSSTIETVLIDKDMIYVGGSFNVVRSAAVRSLARYSISTNQWLDFAPSPSHYIDGIPTLVNDRTMLAIGAFRYGADGRLNNVAEWNSGRWNSLNGGLIRGIEYRLNTYSRTGDSSWNAYVRINEDVYGGGGFSHADNVECNGIFRFRDGIVTPLDSGFRFSSSNFQSNSTFRAPNVNVMVNIGGALVVGGDFVLAGSSLLRCNSLALWNGAKWSTFGNGVYADTDALGTTENGVVFDLYDLPPQGLVVAGRFRNCGLSLLANGLALYGRGTWRPLLRDDGSTFTNDIRQICSYANRLFVVGRCDSTRTQSSVYELVDSTLHEWIPPVQGYDARVDRVCAFNDKLYVGGSFRSVGNVPAENVAVYDFMTSSWSALGSGLTNRRPGDTDIVDDSLAHVATTSIRSIVVHNDTVFFSGDFAYAGNKPSLHLASWYPSTASFVSPDNNESNSPAVMVFPNPTSGQFSVRLRSATSSIQQVKLVSLLGRTCYEQVWSGSEASSEVHCESADVQSGLYICRVQDSKGEWWTTTVLFNPQD